MLSITYENVRGYHVIEKDRTLGEFENITDALGFIAHIIAVDERTGEEQAIARNSEEYMINN